MYCLDTDTIVDFLRGNKNVSAKAKQNAGNLFATEISILELYLSVKKEEPKSKFLS